MDSNKVIVDYNIYTNTSIFLYKIFITQYDGIEFAFGFKTLNIKYDTKEFIRGYKDFYKLWKVFNLKDIKKENKLYHNEIY